MEEALYSKYGFFSTEKVRSKKSGDFLTSPEVSEYFGKILNKWILKNNLDLNITCLLYTSPSPRDQRGEGCGR